MLQFSENLYYGSRDIWKYKIFLVVAIISLPVLLPLVLGWLLIQLIKWAYKTFHPLKPLHPASKVIKKNNDFRSQTGKKHKIDAKPVNQTTQTPPSTRPIAGPDESTLANKTILEQAATIRKQKEIIENLYKNDLLIQNFKNKYIIKIRGYRELIYRLEKRVSKLRKLQRKRANAKIRHLKELLENEIENNMNLKKQIERFERENLLAKAKQGYRDGSPLDPTDIRMIPSETDTAPPATP
ncbi:MAG TPA: hypothetical protein PLO56_15290 [Rhodothermales bacterium]|nr:hypothetical protein [Rhodothermales bacterium]